VLPCSSHVLQTLIRDLQRFVVPQVQADDARLTLALANSVLSGLAVEESARERRLAAQQSADLGLLLAQLNTVSGPLSGDQKKLVESQAQLIECLVEELDGLISGSTFGAHPVATQQQITREQLTDYLRGKVPEFPLLEVASLVEIGGGLSKKTYRLEVARGPEHWDRLILRQDVIGGPTPLSVLDEIAVQRLVEEAGLPVPHVYWIEDDCRHFDTAFVLNQRLPGVCDAAAWRVQSDAVDPPWRQVARYLARLHRISPADLPSVKVRAPASELLLQFVTGIEQRWVEETPFIDPLVQLGFAWLKRNLPQNVPRITLVHADLSERNILLHDGQITGLLDWELWHIGDPVYDLAYLQPLISQLTEWQRFLDCYYAHGAPESNLANLRYWYICSEFRNVAMLASGLRTFIDGRNRNLKLIAAVMHSYRRRLALGMRQLLPLL
jgi:aminoglycoside phosphotransferase (APT) family kinase protein